MICNFTYLIVLSLSLLMHYNYSQLVTFKNKTLILWHLFCSVLNIIMHVSNFSLTDVLWMFWIDKNIYYQMSSFNESVGLGLLKTDAIEFVKYPCIFSFVATSYLTCSHVSPCYWTGLTTIWRAIHALSFRPLHVLKGSSYGLFSLAKQHRYLIYMLTVYWNTLKYLACVNIQFKLWVINGMIAITNICVNINFSRTLCLSGLHYNNNKMSP